MRSFLSHVVDDILQKDVTLTNTLFIVPSKRAGTFFKNELKSKIQEPLLFPVVNSIEEFIYELSSIRPLDGSSLLFEFYTVYLNNTPKKLQDNFETFCKWAPIALQDFNEIDRHLVDQQYIFDYLKSIDRLNNWNLDKDNSTSLIEKHLHFFDRLHTYYKALYVQLSTQKIGYQGVQYREAFENLQNYIETHRATRYVFIGFNALNKAEEVIIKEFLDNDMAFIYWDADSFYFNQHPAATFLRKYKNKWNYYKNNKFNWIDSNFDKEKNIRVIGAAKNATQIKYVGDLLATFNSLESTAIVLADESLLPMCLSSLPQEVEQLNITMGYELKNMPLTALIDTIFELHISANGNQNRFYHKLIIRLFSLPEIRKLVDPNGLLQQITENNFIYVSSEQLLVALKETNTNIDSISFLFESWNDDANHALDKCQQLIELLRIKSNDTLETEFLFKINGLLIQLKQLNDTSGYLGNLSTLRQVFMQLLKSEKLFFQGEPLSGLQLMGMLETRVLDFETVIITSVNEGILPVGKTDNSFIPFDVKKDPKVNIPTYQERDAIFSYHFFRLLQRAKNIYLLYNTENDHYGLGEQSRFITQLEVLSETAIEKYIVRSKIHPQGKSLNEIKKSSGLIESLKNLAVKGVSPTALTTYINNPLDFYQQKVLGIQRFDQAEETVASNTLGTVIHKTLEALYTPFKRTLLKKEHIEMMRSKSQKEVLRWFKEIYKNGDISSGQNLLIYHVAQQFVLNFLDKEAKLLEQANSLVILELEFDLKTTVQLEGYAYPVTLKGQADRIDELNGTIRIIDYKTGHVTPRDVQVKDWSLIIEDYKFSKCFQVMLYALMYQKMLDFDLEKQPLESGIISFRNLGIGFMKVNKNTISKQDMQAFIEVLEQLLSVIFDPHIPFVENEFKYF